MLVTKEQNLVAVS